MGRIDDIFSQLRNDGRTAVMPFIVAAYPETEAAGIAPLGFEAAGARFDFSYDTMAPLIDSVLAELDRLDD